MRIRLEAKRCPTCQTPLAVNAARGQFCPQGCPAATPQAYVYARDPRRQEAGA